MFTRARAGPPLRGLTTLAARGRRAARAARGERRRCLTRLVRGA